MFTHDTGGDRGDPDWVYWMRNFSVSWYSANEPNTANSSNVSLCRFVMLGANVLHAKLIMAVTVHMSKAKFVNEGRLFCC